MEHELKTMCELLEEHISVQGSLLELSQEKKQVIISGNTERLNEIVQTELKSLARMNSIEKRRTALVAALSKELGVQEGELTVSVLSERAGGTPAGSRLTALQEELTKLLREQADQNNINKKLLETQLEYTDTMLNLIVGPDDPLNNFYGGDGRTTDAEIRKSAGIFDQEI